MLPQEKIKTFLLHPISLVRDFTGRYFYNKKYQSPDLMDWVFKATDQYGPENCIGLLAGAREFQLNQGHFDRILHHLRELSVKKQYDLLRRQYEFLLLYAPAEFLRNNAKVRLDLSPLLVLLGYPVNPMTDAALFTIRSLGDHNLVDKIFRFFPHATTQFRSRSLESIVTIKHESVKMHCLSYLPKAKKPADRYFVYECLAGLLSEDCLGVLEKGVKKQNYDTQYDDLSETLLIVKIIMADDLTGESEYSRELAKKNAAKEAQRLEMEKIVSRFMQGN
jgi:hypothetical protein